MKATDLAKALNEIDDAYLAELDTSEKELITMKNRKRISRILIAAAIICLLTVTAFAAEQARIHSFTNRGQEYQESYEALEQAIEKAGFKLNLPEEFSSGFRFKDVRTGEVVGDDGNGNQVLTFMDLRVDYENSQGQQVGFYAIPNLGDAVTEDERIPVASKTVGEITLNYYVDHYVFVPEGYKLSEEEQEWAQQPGNYISFGADTVEEQAFASLKWITPDGKFSFMEMGTSIAPDVLFAMAEEIIQ